MVKEASEKLVSSAQTAPLAEILEMEEQGSLMDTAEYTDNPRDNLSALPLSNLTSASNKTSTNSSDSRLNVVRPDNGPTPWRNFIAIGILFCVNLLNYMDRYTIAGVLTDVQKFYGMSDSEAGLLQTVFICSYMIFAPICGYLGDRYNRKYIMATGIFIWSGTVLASTFVPRDQFYLFMLCRAVVGIGEASYSTVSPTIIADLFHSDLRSKMLMVFYFAIPVGSGMGFVVGSNVANLMGAWQWGVRVTPILGVILLVLILLILIEPERGESDGTAVRDDSSFTNDLKHLARNRTYVWSTLGFTCVAFVAGCLSWWTPNLVIYGKELTNNTTATGDTKSSVGFIFGVITCLSGFVGVAGGAMAATKWRQTNGRADPLVCAIGLVTATPFLFAGLNMVEPHLEAAWVLMFFAVTFVSLNWSIVSDILLYIVTPRRRSVASAFQILISHLLGDAFSPYLVGAVSDALRGADRSKATHFASLKYALFIPTFVLVFGGLFFIVSAYYVLEDKRNADLAIQGIEANRAVQVGKEGKRMPTSESNGLLLARDEIYNSTKGTGAGVVVSVSPATDTARTEVA